MINEDDDEKDPVISAYMEIYQSWLRKFKDQIAKVNTGIILGESIKLTRIYNSAKSEIEFGEKIFQLYFDHFENKRFTYKELKEQMAQNLVELLSVTKYVSKRHIALDICNKSRLSICNKSKFGEMAFVEDKGQPKDPFANFELEKSVKNINSDYNRFLNETMIDINLQNRNKNEIYNKENFKARIEEQQNTRQYQCGLIQQDYKEDQNMLSQVDNYNENFAIVQDMLDEFLVNYDEEIANGTKESDQNDNEFKIECCPDTIKKEAIIEIMFATKFNHTFFRIYKKNKISYKQQKQMIKELQKEFWNTQKKERNHTRRKTMILDKEESLKFTVDDSNRTQENCIESRRKVLENLVAYGIEQTKNNGYGTAIEDPVLLEMIDDYKRIYKDTEIHFSSIMIREVQSKQKYQSSVDAKQSKEQIDLNKMLFDRISKIKDKTANEIVFAEKFFESYRDITDTRQKGVINRFITEIEEYLNELEYWDGINDV